MNTFWLKVAAIVVVIVAVIVLIAIFTSSEKSPPAVEQSVMTSQAEEPASQAEEKTFGDMVERDREKFLAEPQPLEEIAEEPEEAPAEQPVREQNQPKVTQLPSARSTGVEPNVVKPKPQPTKLYFAPLSEIDSIEAERLLNVAVPGRSIGRLPMTGYKLMVDTCRQIISKWPDSWYAYRAQQMLIDMPERFRGRYNITQEELDISKFTKKRPGTELFTGTVKVEEGDF
jgi:hypothetical protein